MGAQRRGGIDSIKEKRGKDREREREGKGQREREREGEREEKMEFCFSINERCLRCQRDVA